MIEINHNPSRNELRWFGLMFAGFFGLFGLMIWWQFDALHVSRVLWIVGIAVGVIYYAVPPLQKRIYVGWLYLTYPLGWVMNHLIMGITYYLVLTPIGLFMRAIGRDAMDRKLDRQASTYWKPHKPAADASRYFKQF